MNAVQKRHRPGMTLLQPSARRGGFQRKTHLDVGGGKLVAGKPGAFPEFAFPERHVLLDLRIDKRGQRLVRHHAHHWTQQRGRAPGHQAEHQFQQQRRHRRAFRVVQPVSIAQPLGRPLRRDQAPFPIGIDDVFGDRAGFRDGIALIGYHGRFSQRMDRAQLRRRAHVRLTLVADDLIGHAEFFQQPQHPLRAGIIEVMDGEHGTLAAFGPDGARPARQNREGASGLGAFWPAGARSPHSGAAVDPAPANR
jgi:hypothetical protein